MLEKRLNNQREQNRKETSERPFRQTATQEHVVRRQSVERPNVLRPTSQNIPQTESNDFNKKLNQMVQLITQMSENYEKLLGTADRLIAGQVSLKDLFSDFNTRISGIESRLEKINRSIIPVEGLFSEEMIEKARDQLGLDLTLDLNYNGVFLLNTPFQHNNINLFGTKLLDILFSKEEQSQGLVEPAKNKTASLDQQRVDLIKICYLKKLKSIENFNEYWPSVVKSLRQKCIDARRNLKKNNNIEENETVEPKNSKQAGKKQNDDMAEEDEDEEDEIVRPTTRTRRGIADLEDDETDEEDETMRKPIQRDVTMHSLNF